MRTIVSGIRNIEEALYFINAGVNGLGFVLEPKSKHYVNPEQAREIILKLPPLITTIGVFEDTPRYVIQELTTFCRLDWLLFFGSELPKDCEDYHQPIIKYLPQFELHKDYNKINSFLVKQDKGNCFIYHNKEAEKRLKVFAVYFEVTDVGAINK